MTIAVESYYNFAYNNYDIAEESLSLSKIFVAIENGFRDLIAMFKKLIQKIMGLKKCRLPIKFSIKTNEYKFLKVILRCKKQT